MERLSFKPTNCCLTTKKAKRSPPKPVGSFVTEEEIDEHVHRLSATCGELTGTFFRDIMFVRDSQCKAGTQRLNSYIRTVFRQDDKRPRTITKLPQMVSEIIDYATHPHQADCCYAVNGGLFCSIATLDIDDIKPELSDEEIVEIITNNLRHVRWIIRSGKGIHVVFKYRKPFYFGETKKKVVHNRVLNGSERFTIYHALSVLEHYTKKFSDVTTLSLQGIFEPHELLSVKDLSTIQPRFHLFRFPGVYNPKRKVFSYIIYYDEHALFDITNEGAAGLFSTAPPIAVEKLIKDLFPSQTAKVTVPFSELEQSEPPERSEGEYPRINNFNFNPKTFFYLPFIRKIFQNGYRVPEGLRYHVGTTIAIACRLRNIPYEKAETIMEDYVNHHTQSGSHPYTISQAQATLRSMYRRNPPWEVSGRKMLSELGYHLRLPDISFSEIYSFVFNVSVSLHKRKTKPYSLNILEILKEYQKTKNPYPSSYDFLKSINKNSKTYIYQILKNVYLLSRSIDKQGKPYKVYLYKGLKSFYLRLYSTLTINSKYRNNILSKCDKRMREEILKILKEIWKEYDEGEVTEYIDMLNEEKVKGCQEQTEELMRRAPPWEEVRTLSPDGWEL